MVAVVVAVDKETETIELEISHVCQLFVSVYIVLPAVADPGGAPADLNFFNFIVSSATPATGYPGSAPDSCAHFKANTLCAIK